MQDNYTLKKLAQELGVSWQMFVSWRRKDLLPANAINSDGTYNKSKIEPLLDDLKNGTLPEPKGKSPKKKPKPVARKKAETPPADFDEFVRRYWQENKRAVDVLLMPPEVTAQVIEHVNEALRYAFEHSK